MLHSLTHVYPKFIKEYIQIVLTEKHAYPKKNFVHVSKAFFQGQQIDEKLAKKKKWCMMEN